MAVIVIIDSMTSVFNTDASLPYSHDLFESLIVKKRIKNFENAGFRRNQCIVFRPSRLPLPFEKVNAQFTIHTCTKMGLKFSQESKHTSDHLPYFIDSLMTVYELAMSDNLYF
ncbi:hypothetical protein CLF_110289 [Clonorchis sinensis]|uniref:Uncharacterized protein n=1 Tax=Clonorchis sinensis TaxID=79923 RepID=G7YTC8_CLOSI|nr:hypothetical protein CLF_110289 [Clonorchis sinensis]